MYSICDFSQPVPLADSGLTLPLAGDKVCAGFPSPAEDFAVKRIDLTQELVTHPQATFLLRVSGESMRDAGIFDGDMLVVNKALKPRHGQVVVAVVDGEFTVKYLYQRAGRVKLKAANATYPDITPKDGQTLEVHTSVEHWAAKTFRQRHVIRRGDDLICEGTEVRAFCERDPAHPDRIRALPVPEDIRLLCS